MANTASAKKQMRSNERRRLRNRMHIGRARTEVRKAREAIASGDVSAASEAVRMAARWLDHAASKGSIHHANAARRKGRLMHQLSLMGTAAVAEPAAPEKPAKASKAAKPKAEKATKAAPKAAPKAAAEKAPKASKATASKAKKTDEAKPARKPRAKKTESE